MAYITIAQLLVHYSENKIVQLSDKGNAGVRDDVVLQKAIDRATAIIDGALSKCYVLPLAMADGSALPSWMTMRLEEMCGRITLYTLAEDTMEAISPKPAVQARYEEEMKTLGALDPGKRTGCAWLPGVALNPASVDGANDVPNVMFHDDGNTFGRNRRDNSEFADREWP